MKTHANVLLSLTADDFSGSVAASAEDEAYRYLLDGICRGRLPQGARLIAEDIATELQMSRMPVRGAFKRLAAEHLLTLRPNRGAVVSGLNQAQMREVFEMRAVLEGLAARISAPLLTAKHIAHMHRLLSLMEDEPHDPYDWVNHHRVFHEFMCSFSQRPRLMRQISLLNSSIAPYMHLWRQQLSQPTDDRATHAALIDVFASRDPDAAERAIRQHVEETIPLLNSVLN